MQEDLDRRARADKKIIALLFFAAMLVLDDAACPSFCLPDRLADVVCFTSPEGFVLATNVTISVFGGTGC